MWDLSPLTLGIDRPWSFCPTLMDNHRFVASFKWTLAFGLKVLRPLLLNLWHWPPFDSVEREIGGKVGGSAHRLVGRYSILNFLFSSLTSWRECTMHMGQLKDIQFPSLTMSNQYKENFLLCPSKCTICYGGQSI